MSPQVIYPEQMRKGFEATVYSVDDLRLDVPEAPDYIALFLARAVIDDVLPPAMIAKLHDEDSSIVSEVQKKAEVHLSARHCTERMLRCWGAGNACFIKLDLIGMTRCRNALSRHQGQYREDVIRVHKQS